MDTNQFGIIIDQLAARYVALGLITSAPFEIVFFQAALAIREHTITTRKEYNSDDSDYQMLKWISEAMTYIGVCQFIVGIVLLLRSL
jgi:hypothetical protein